MKKCYNIIYCIGVIMDVKDIQQLAKSCNSIGYKIYFVHNIKEFINKEPINSYYDRDSFVFITKNKYDEINPKEKLIIKDLGYSEKCLQEITKNIQLDDKDSYFYLYTSEKFYDRYWNIFLPEMVKHTKVLFPLEGLPQFKDIKKKFSFQDIVKIYSSAPVSNIHNNDFIKIYQYIAQQDYSTLKTVREEELAKIFLKTKKIHSSVPSGEASHFEHFFSNPEIIDKIKEHSRFLVENNFSLQKYLSNYDIQQLYIDCDIKTILSTLSINDGNIFKDTYNKVFNAVAEFHGYKFYNETYPQRGISLFNYLSTDQIKPISVAKFWEDVECVYKVALKNNVPAQQIADSVKNILEQKILEDMIPESKNTSKPKIAKF